LEKSSELFSLKKIGDVLCIATSIIMSTVIVAELQVYTSDILCWNK